MNLIEFKHEAQPMLSAVDEAMARMFGRPQTAEERRAELERKEDEHIVRKANDAPVGPMCSMHYGRKTGRGV